MSRTMSVMMLGVLLVGSVPAFSQYRDDRNGGYRNDPYRNDPYRNDPYRNRGHRNDGGYYGQYPQDRNERWGRKGRGQGGYRGNNNVIGRVQRDLSQIASYSRVSSKDRDRFRKAQSELSRFESKWQREGRFDKGHLDRAIDNLNDLLRSRQIDPRQQNVLRAGRDALRDFRATGGANGGYYNNGAYRNGGYRRPW